MENQFVKNPLKIVVYDAVKNKSIRVYVCANQCVPKYVRNAATDYMDGKSQKDAAILHKYYGAQWKSKLGINLVGEPANGGADGADGGASVDGGDAGGGYDGEYDGGSVDTFTTDTSMPTPYQPAYITGGANDNANGANIDIADMIEDESFISDSDPIRTSRVFEEMEITERDLEIRTCRG
jgi:hypothetical protein